MSDTVTAAPVSAALLAQANAEVGMGWGSQARLDCAKALYEQGLSASQIATRIGGVTRNAVIGILHRKGWARDRPLQGRFRTRPQPGKRKAAAQKPKPQTTWNKPSPFMAFYLADAETYVQPVEELVIPENERKYISTLTDNCCRWPIGDPRHSDFHFCGKGKVKGLPYCEFHTRRAFQPPAQRRRDAAQPVLSIVGGQDMAGGGEGSQSQPVPAGDLAREPVSAK